jgi:hypothetical protein
MAHVRDVMSGSRLRRLVMETPFRVKKIPPQ